MSAGNEQAPKSKRKLGGITRTSWLPGCPSPNPGGRPRRALAMAEAVRTELDPTEWVTFELSIARDEKQPLEVRRASWLALIDRGFVKAPTTLDITTGERSEVDLSGASEEQIRAALAALEAPNSHHVVTPSPTDENTKQLPQPAQEADA